MLIELMTFVLAGAAIGCSIAAWRISAATAKILRNVQGASQARLVIRPARRLLAIAAGLLLPPDHRDRYQEEFRSDLVDLAAAGAGWWRQLGYVGRQLVRAAPLAVAVRTPSRKRATP